MHLYLEKLIDILLLILYIKHIAYKKY